MHISSDALSGNGWDLKRAGESSKIWKGIMTLMQAKYGIWVMRGSGSIFGPAEAWCKRDGVLEVFCSEKEAQQMADHYNNVLRSTNIRYYVKEMEPGLIEKGVMACGGK